MNLTHISKEAYDTACAKGFHPQSVMMEAPKCRDMKYMATRIALIHSEASEALEELRNIPFDREAFGEELADTIIRIADLAYIAGVDLELQVFQKMEKNKTREHRHGGRAL